MAEKTFGLRLKWLGCACFEMDFGGVTIVNDPWITPNPNTELDWEAVEKCDYITVTHGHYDHTGAVVELAEYYGGIPAYLHENDAARTKIPFSLMPDIGETVHYGEGDEIAVGNLTVHVYHTPGHSSGSVVLECEDVLFTGDTLFQGSCGRTDLPGGSMDEILISLKRLAEMEGDRKVYPGHEGFSNLDAERKGNYYMLLGMKQ